MQFLLFQVIFLGVLACIGLECYREFSGARQDAIDYSCNV